MQLPGHQPPRYGVGPAENIWWQVVSGSWQYGRVETDPSVMPPPPATAPGPDAPPPPPPPPRALRTSFLLRSPTDSLVSEARPTLFLVRGPLLYPPVEPCFRARNKRPPPSEIFPARISPPRAHNSSHNSSQPPPAACQAWSAHPALVCPHSVHGPRNPSRHPDSFPRPPLIRAYRPRFLPPRVLPPRGRSPDSSRSRVPRPPFPSPPLLLGGSPPPGRPAFPSPIAL